MWVDCFDYRTPYRFLHQHNAEAKLQRSRRFDKEKNEVNN